jgi:outer membrane protein OmpA-like peptidoglycan-associated protein
MEYGNLLESYTNLLTLPLSRQAPHLLGQPVEVGNGIGQLLANLFGAIVQRGEHSSEGASALLGLLNSPSVDTGLLSQNPDDAIAGFGQSGSLVQHGQVQIGQLFGTTQANLVEAASNATGVNFEQSATLSAAATPFALALIKQTLSPSGAPIGAAQLADFLESQKPYFGGLSEAFFGTLGLGGLGAWLAARRAPAAVAAPAVAAPAPAAAPSPARAAAPAPAPSQPAKKGHKWLLWVLLAAVIVALLAWCSQHGSGTSDQSASGAAAASDAGSAASAANAVAASDQGTPASVVSAASAASGADTASAASTAATDASVASEAPAASAAASTAVSSAATDQASDAGLPLKVYFATGKAALHGDFRKQAQAVVAYAKAHPDAKFTVTGFTDSRGSAQLNVALAKRRAEAVVHALAAHGIDASRLSIARPASSGDEIGGTGQEGRRVEVAAQ